MTLRKMRRRIEQKRKYALLRFKKQKRLNLLATPGKYQYIIVLDHLKPAFNIGKILRSADAFGALEVHLIGTDFFDPAPAMGSFKWVPTRFHEDFETCYKELSGRGYALFIAEPSPGESLLSVEFPLKSAFIFGNEEFGISFDKDDYEGTRLLNIPQFGKVRSLNVSIAASVVMYEYVRQQ